MIQFKENAQTDGKMEGQKDRQTLFYRTLPANAGGPINFFYSTANQLSKFRTKNWIEINDELYGTYDTNRWNEFKITMLKSSLCEYSDP